LREIEAAIALIAYLLLRLVATRHAVKGPLSTFSRLLGSALMERRTIVLSIPARPRHPMTHREPDSSGLDPGIQNHAGPCRHPESAAGTAAPSRPKPRDGPAPPVFPDWLDRVPAANRAQLLAMKPEERAITLRTIAHFYSFKTG
jgi:hypothetical protein